MSDRQYEGGQADSRMVLEKEERPGVFRPKYRKLDDGELERMNAVKAKAQELWDAMDEAEVNKPGGAWDPADGRPGSREHALARTKLEEAVMWAVKGLTG